MAPLSYAQIEGYWIAAGGDPAVAPIAAAITFPESGGDPQVIQQGQPYATTGWGLWQITPGNSVPQCGVDRALLDPSANACAAVAKWKGRGQSFQPWTTYNNGAYKRYLQSGVAPSGASAAASPAGINQPADFGIASSIGDLVGKITDLWQVLLGLAILGAAAIFAIYQTPEGRAAINRGVRLARDAAIALVLR